MKNPTTRYISTPIFYVNDVPHLGTAYTCIAADIWARFQRMQGHDVFFLTGTDENALKVARAADEVGEEPQAFCDRLAMRFRYAWTVLGISHDDFIRTTEPRHRRAVNQFLTVLNEKGLIYRGTYESWYCVHEETFLSGDEVQDELCPICKRPVQWVEEPCHYFRLSAFRDNLLEYFERPNALQPTWRAAEPRSYTEAGLRDVSISRRSDWGIPLPESFEAGDGQVVYVWADALVNYISAIGYGSDDPADLAKFERYWPADVHLVGKDIFTRFHCTMWPALLQAAGLELPQVVYGHGFWNVEGRKMSKSLGNVVDPLQVVATLSKQASISSPIAADVLRYFLFREMPFGADGDFQSAHLTTRYNEDLANDLGNLFHRVLKMVGRYQEGQLPAPSLQPNPTRSFIIEAQADIASDLDNFDYLQALKRIWAFLRKMNQLVETKAPWTLANEGKHGELQAVLQELMEGLNAVTVFLTPFMPTVAAELAHQLGIEAPTRWEQASRWNFQPGTSISQIRPVFPRLETDSL